MGNRFSHPSAAANLSSCDPGMVTATACLGKLSPALANAAATRIMPFRVSGVPPLLLVTRTKV